MNHSYLQIHEDTILGTLLHCPILCLQYKEKVSSFKILKYSQIRFSSNQLLSHAAEALEFREHLGP